MIDNFRYIIQRQMYGGNPSYTPYSTIGSSYTNMPYSTVGSDYGEPIENIYRKTIEDYTGYYNPLTNQLEQTDMLASPGLNVDFLQKAMPFTQIGSQLYSSGLLGKLDPAKGVGKFYSENIKPFYNLKNIPSYFEKPEYLGGKKQWISGTKGTELSTLPGYTGGSAYTGESISDFYASQGKTLPSVAERASDYTAITGKTGYTGTAAQNIEMIEGLKSGEFGGRTPGSFKTVGDPVTWDKASRMQKTGFYAKGVGQTLGDPGFAGTVGTLGWVGKMLFDDKNPYTYTTGEQAADIASKYGTAVTLAKTVAPKVLPALFGAGTTLGTLVGGAAFGPLALLGSFLMSRKKKRKIAKERKKIEKAREEEAVKQYSYHVRRPEREAEEASYLEYASRFDNPYGLAGMTANRAMYEDGGKFTSKNLTEEFATKLSAKEESIYDIFDNMSDSDYDSFANYIGFVLQNENPRYKGYQATNDTWKPYILEKEKKDNKGNPYTVYEIDIGFGRMLKEFTDKDKADKFIENFNPVSSADIKNMMLDDFINHYDRSRRKVDHHIKNLNIGGSGYGAGTFDSLPFNQRLMLTDYDYTGTLGKFPKLVNAVVNNDYELALSEYARHSGEQPMTTRNESTLNYFFNDAFSDPTGTYLYEKNPLKVNDPHNKAFQPPLMLRQGEGVLPNQPGSSLLNIDWMNPANTPNITGDTPPMKEGGKKRGSAELTGDELIVDSYGQSKIEQAIENNDASTVSKIINSNIKEGSITKGPSNHKTNPQVVAEDGTLYKKNKPTDIILTEGDGIYDNASKQFKIKDNKSTLSDKQILNVAKKNVAKWLRNEMA
jgi:hypothetical protein